MTQVTLQNLSKIYPQQTAVHPLNLTIPAGQITALLGPSGCGKTTILKMIAGLIEPTQGDIFFDEQSVLNLPPERREAVMAFQNNLLFPHMTIGQNVGFGLKMRGVKTTIMAERVAQMLQFVQLPGLESRYPQQLSGGQQQRVALARALIIQPRVLLLDEPLSSLDAHLRGEMRDLIREIQQQLRLTIIVVTHDQAEAVILADYIALMFTGQLHQFGPPRDFYERPKTEQTARFFGGVNFIQGHLKGQELQTETGLFSYLTPSPSSPQVWLTIRPEHVQLHHTATHNLLTAQLHEMIYLGTHARFKFKTTTNLTLEAITPADQIHQFTIGQTLSLHLPPDKIWLLARP